MKILQVIECFAPACGGPVTSVYNLSRELTRRNNEVSIATTDFEFDKPITRTIEEEGVTIIPFPCVADIGSFLISPSISKWLRYNLKDFDVIHMHNFRSYQNFIVHHYARKYDVPYILQPRGSVPRISKTKQKKLFDMLLGRSIIKYADKIVASSKIESDQYSDVFPKLEKEKIVHISNSLDLETYKDLPERGKFREKCSISDDEKMVLFLSRIHKRKGADLLLEAFNKAKNELENIKLVFVGPDEGHLNKLKLRVRDLNIESDVLFPGPRYGRDKLEAYVDADVFVLPSKDRYESFGNVVLEALACGTPVIATNNCGVLEWIGDGVGCVVEYDEEQLTNALVETLCDEGLSRESGEKGRRLVLREFGLEKTVGRLEELYRDMIPIRERS